MRIYMNNSTRDLGAIRKKGIEALTEKLGPEEGDNLSIEVSNGKVIITPVAVIPKDELWAWSTNIRSAIEAGKHEAKKGTLKEYASVDELWNDLHVAETED